MREADLEQQVLVIFDKMKVENDDVRDWVRLVLASQTRDAQAESMSQRGELQRQETLLVQQQDRLLNMRLSEDIDQETFARKHTELRDQLASIKLQLDVVDRSHDETAELAAKVFEFSQTLRRQWLTTDYAAKRRILEIVFLNCSLDDVTLVPTMRKPFDVLAEGLVSEKSRDDTKADYMSGWSCGHNCNESVARINATRTSGDSCNSSCNWPMRTSLAVINGSPNPTGSVTKGTSITHAHVPLKSYHVGGVHILLADGSVRFLGDSTDALTCRRLAVRDDGQVLGEY